MKLSSLVGLGNEVKLVSDCEFNALGMATSIYTGRKVLSFLSDIKYLDSILKNQSITGVICTRDIYVNSTIPDSLGVLLADNPKIAFYQIHNKLSETEFYWKKFENKISKNTSISSKAFIGEHSVEIGNHSIVEAGASIHPGTIIGDNVIIRSGSQIGTIGFQFLSTDEGVLSVKTAGRTIIKDNVEIQHNCCIDRGVLGGDTIIEKDVKVDNLVHIAHDDHIGERTFITAGVKLSGRVIIGEDCWIGVNATISNGVKIGKNCKVTLGSVVTKDVPSNITVSGNFAIDHKRFIQHIKSII